MSMANKRLGKGFDALFPTDLDPMLIGASEQVQSLSLDSIKPNPSQPRRTFHKQALEELAASIKQYGVVQPLIASPNSDNTFTLIAGERRWRAARLAGLRTVPVIVRNQKELEQLEIALVENVQRVDLSPLEQAVSIERLHQQFNKSYKEIAKRLGKAETTVVNIVRLLQLPITAREALQSGSISEGHARAILSLKNQDYQEKLLRLIKRHKWSVRQAEQYASRCKQGIISSQATTRKAVIESPETKRLSKLLNTKVQIKRAAKGGYLEIHFTSEEKLKTIALKLLEK